MSYGLSFSEEFFTGTELMENIEISERPTSILQALVSWAHLNKEEFINMLNHACHISPITLEFYTNCRVLPEDVFYDLIEKIRRVDSCTNITVPVEVWIDRSGFYTVKVYE